MSAARGRRWQRNWRGDDCMVIEDPSIPGYLRQIADQIIRITNPVEKPGKRIWPRIPSLRR